MAEKKTDQVMDIEGLAKYLNLSKSTAYKLAQQGVLPGQKVGKHWRFRKETIDRWLDAGAVTGKEKRKHVAGDANGAPSIQTSQEGTPVAMAQGMVRTPMVMLEDILTKEQVARLRERWIETPEQLLSIAATERGMQGICTLLELRREQLEEILSQFRRTMNIPSSGNPFTSTKPGGSLGVRLDDLRPLDKGDTADGEQETSMEDSNDSSAATDGKD